MRCAGRMKHTRSVPPPPTRRFPRTAGTTVSGPHLKPLSACQKAANSGANTVSASVQSTLAGTSSPNNPGEKKLSNGQASSARLRPA